MVSTQGLWNTATNLLGDGNNVTTQDGYVNWARNVVGSNNVVTARGGYANSALNSLGGRRDTLTTQYGYNLETCL